MNLEYEKERLNKITHSVRASQAVLQYGVGAMVDFPDQTLMTAAPETWEGSVVEIHDERLEKVLRVDYFGMPGSKDEEKYQNGVSYARFPEWYFCPKCRKFQPLSSWLKEYQDSQKCKRFCENDPNMVRHVICPKCMQELVVARIIVACGNGHIDDFPWVKWTHAKSQMGARPVCSHPVLKFTTSASSTEGLEGLTITCQTCNARATLAGAFEKDSLKKLDEKTGYVYGFQCTGRHPWKNFKEPCGEYPHVLQRGGSSVYFPITVSSLVIPPYSSQLTAKIQNSSYFSKLKDAIKEGMKAISETGLTITQEIKDNLIRQRISEYASLIANDIGHSAETIRPILERRWNNANEDSYSTSSVKYRAEEYEALNGEVSLPDKHGEFNREEINIELYDIPFVKRISLIHKIREVEALIGFSRLEPADEETINESSKIKRVSVKDEETNWYPGYDVRGEGIFIEFDESAIDRWRSGNERIQRRVDQLNENYANSYYGEQRPRTITSKFLLLHTLSHLLMKQLSFECGYSIASIKERIYCSEANEGKEMSGIFVYTASGDSEGTMGGLVRQGRPDTLPSIFKKAIESAISCSNDPVCSLSMGQGRDSLNLAACYACTLVPETSCEEFNIFLDRGVVIGTYEEREIGFYSSYVYGEMPKKSLSAPTKKANKSQILMTDLGLDLKSAKYKDIWIGLLQFSSDDIEKSNISKLIEHEAEYSQKAHPHQAGTFQIIGDSNYYNADLLWPTERVIVFGTENKEEYIIASKSEWKCFWLGAKDEWERIIKALKEI